MKKRKFGWEKEEIGGSSNQELGEPREPMVFEHEVFLSFRDENTRTNFTALLYDHLTDVRGIRTFRDSEKFYVGETIGPKLMEAINKSKIMMPIFSKGYASSKWCLMELTEMVKFVEMNKETTMICPIFYDVTPSEVRNQTGSFQEAFDGHMKKFDKETVDEWKEALRKVGETKGWERDKIASGDEAQLVVKVGEVLAMLLKKMHVAITEHLVGMDQHEEGIMQLLDLDCDDVKIVGIVGMGGIGKTTIAKFIHNKLCDQFRLRCSFLENVREKVKQSGGRFNDLKKQLMSDILKRKSDGSQMNRSTFKSTKALIVLDDVEDRSQLMNIIGGCDSFGPGSTIIVTTRNRETFREKEGENVYEPGAMNSENALRLFCKHAFRQDCPLKEYEDLSRKIVSNVEGLPLSLEVIGSSLATKNREGWEDTLKKLIKIMPEQIQERLRISYDMLDEGQKDIFLDIACHFTSSEKDKILAANYMWEDCGFFPSIQIVGLVTLSLVKIDENGCFWMHGQLRDLGREIVRNENRKYPGGRSRLWSRQVALDVLTRRTGTEYVQTLTLGKRYEMWSNSSVVCLSSEEFKGLSQLRYLDLSTTSNLQGDFKDLLFNLRWFSWHPSSQNTEINNLCLPKLVVLDLSNSSISDGWDDLIQIKKATNLKVLDLSSCRNLTKTPDLSRFSKLERLNLECCSNLVEILISPSIRHLQHLTYLNLNSCSKLGSMSSKLPEFIWKLKSLEELHMEELGAVTELSEAIRNLANLKILDVKGIEIKKLPKAFGKLEKLEEFNASKCRSLEELPETFGDIQNLKRLDISDSGVNWLPSEIGRLEKLERLDAGGCKSLGEVPESIENLTNLRILDVSSTAIKKLPAGIGKLQKLQELSCGRSSLEGNLPSGLWSLSALRLLRLDETKISSLGAANLSRCSHLTTLDFQGCPELRLPSTELKLPPGLTRLEIPLTKASLDSVASLTKLEILGFHLCDRILTDDLVQCPIDLGGLSRHELKSLHFHGFKNFTSLPVNINNLPWMRCLAINTNADDEGMVALEDGCEFLERLPDLTNTLERIKARNCLQLSHGDGGLAGLTSVVELDIQNCPSLRRLPDFSVRQRLEKLRIHTCRELTDLDGLAGLTSLVELAIFSCPSLHTLPDFSVMQCLTKLVIHDCPTLSYPLQGVDKGHPTLEEVRIEGKRSEWHSFPDAEPRNAIMREKEEIRESSNQEVFEHEVLLSFRGADTRTNFTAHLYRHLSDARRIRTFRDSEMLHVGEKIGLELMEVINKSKIMIPIFSKGYASSKWCLMELTEMVKFVEMNKETTMICPIFYDVTPSEVRNQTGSFQEAFDGHMKNFDKKTVDEWKEALKTVSELKGWERDKIESGDEAELVAKVGEELAVELKKMHVELPEPLVGMDQHEEGIMQLLDCDDVKIVGIVGMGGIGKTTIAKFIYNKLCDQFHQRCSFLEDVRGKVKQSRGLLDDLKKQLMEDILKRKSDGFQMNQSTFRSTKALIVLDDVKNKSQLEEIIGGRDWFGPGSRIIVTTRNRDTFLEEEGEKIFEPKVMNSENALRLFCKHAFRQDSPWEGYEDLTEEIVSNVAGLPLSLEVIGSLLSTKDREVWEDTLKKLRKTMPGEIQERLRISYDMLEDEGQKQIFLDIACHFLYSDEDTRRAASYMWEDCDFYRTPGIHALIALYLVKIDENGRFTMHNQLRDLGREIVRKENPHNPGGRSRLWSRQVALDVLTRRTGTESVETLILGGNQRARLFPLVEKEEDITLGDDANEKFKGLSQLRYLDLSTTSNLQGDFKDLLFNLRWFSWHPSSQNTEINNLCLPKLVVLDLSNSRISDGWDDLIQIKKATNLKVLDLSSCRNLTKTPDLSKFSKLERLNLECCSNLVEILISPSIRHLQHLTYLNLNSCSKLGSMSSKLPEFIWKLKALEELHMNYLRGVTELSEAIRKLANLKILNVKGTEIKKLPKAFGKLKKLEEFNASWCESLEELPETFGDLQNLKRLDISNSGVNWLPSEIGRLEKLERLDAGGCESLGELPDSIGNLRSLILLCIRETRVKRLPSAIGRLEKLEELEARECKSLREFPESIENLTNLRILDVSSTAIKKLPAGIGKLQKLEELSCGRSSLEGELPSGLWSLSALRELKLSNTRISSLVPADLSRFSHLRVLDLGSCSDLRLPSSELKLPPGLTRLEIPLTKASLDSVPSLTKLKILGFHLCDRILADELVQSPIDLGGLSRHELNSLYFRGFKNFTSLPVNINNLPWMRCLAINTKADDEGMVALEDGCELLERLTDLPNTLKRIKARNCLQLSHTDGGLAGLTSVVELDIQNCPSLRRLPDFSVRQRLEKLRIHTCRELTDLDGLAGLTSLVELAIFSCPSLHTLPDFSVMQCLTKLVIHDCPTLSYPLQGVDKGHPTLEEVRIEGKRSEWHSFPDAEPRNAIMRYAKNFI